MRQANIDKKEAERKARVQAYKKEIAAKTIVPLSIKPIKQNKSVNRIDYINKLKFLISESETLYNNIEKNKNKTCDYLLDDYIPKLTKQNAAPSDISDVTNKFKTLIEQCRHDRHIKIDEKFNTYTNSFKAYINYLKNKLKQQQKL